MTDDSAPSLDPFGTRVAGGQEQSLGDVWNPAYDKSFGSFLQSIGDTAGQLVEGTGNALVHMLGTPGAVFTGKVAPEQIVPQARQMAGELAGFGMGIPTPPGSLASFSAWHGTPHTFEPVEGNPFGEFRDSAIGSGEGAQAYGYGHYVAGNPEVAQGYAKNLSKIANWIKTGVEPDTIEGNLLEVHVKPGEDELLDWDKPAARQDPAIFDKMKQFNLPIMSKYDPTSFDFSKSGGDFYNSLSHALGSDAAASQALHEAGIPGIKYLDGGSRNIQPQIMWKGQPWKTADDISEQGQSALAAVTQNKDIDATINKLRNWIRKPSTNEGADYAAASADWLDNNRQHIDVVTPKQTHNYVIFHPSNLTITARNGQRLDPVPHDPFSEPSP